MHSSWKSEIKNYAVMIFGVVLFSLGVNLFITPLNLYNGGAVGIAQLLRTAAVDYLHIPVSKNIDLSGIIYFAINLPLMIFAYKGINKVFFLKTCVSVVVLTLTMTLIPIPATPIIGDILTSCIVGGLISGAGIGLCLRSGGSGGGLDIVGIYVSTKYRNFSVGKLSILINVFIYAVCALMFSFEVFIYSVIYAAVYSIMLDKFHSQNIMIQVTIFTKVEGIHKPIMEQLYRGVTEWKGDGAYTHEETNILCTAISKYEIPVLRKIVLGMDPKAFIIYNEVSSIDGNFIKKL